MGELDGKAALVTGGGTGIGLGCARRLAADGALVTICGRRADVLATAAAEIGHGARFVVCDVQDEDQVAAAAAAAAEPLGGLHVAVVNAGGGVTAASEVMFGWATEDELQPNIDGLSRDEVLLVGLVPVTATVLISRLVDRRRRRSPHGGHHGVAA